MSNKVLLDTNCAAGYLSEIQSKASLWNEVVEIICESIHNPQIVIPTPTCIELARTNGNWYKLITSINVEKNQEIKSLFAFSNYSITPEIYYSASRYLLLTGNKKIKKGNKISIADALIASYSITYNYYLITTNQKDFSHKFFDVVKIIEAPRLKENSERESAWLLKPNRKNWTEATIRLD